MSFLEEILRFERLLVRLKKEEIARIISEFPLDVDQLSALGGEFPASPPFSRTWGPWYREQELDEKIAVALSRKELGPRDVVRIIIDEGPEAASLRDVRMFGQLSNVRLLDWLVRQYDKRVRR